MKWRNPDQERPYYSKYQKLQVENHRDWFQVYQLPGHVIAICEPQHLQEVNVFLIFGEEKVLMMDSGMGICDIRPLVEELCAREDELHGKEGGSYFSTLEVVNCHCHFDHTGASVRSGARQIPWRRNKRPAACPAPLWPTSLTKTCSYRDILRDSFRPTTAFVPIATGSVRMARFSTWENGMWNSSTHRDTPRTTPCSSITGLASSSPGT